MSELPIPGSVQLIDSGAVSHSHTDDVLLVPKPSNDVNDPLRWSRNRKQIAHLMLVLYTTTVGISCTALYSVLVPIEEATSIPLSTLNAGTGYMFLLLGWGGLLTQPLAMTFGKRPVYLFSQAASIGVVVWMAFIRTESQWLANKVIQGLVASPIEMLIEVSIVDMFYAHERGFYLGLYAFVLFGSNFVAPMIAGWINELHGYKWVFYFSAIQQAVGLVLSILFLEETNYHRVDVETRDNPVEYDENALESEKTVGAVNIVQPALSRSTEAGLQGTVPSRLRRMGLFQQRYTTMKQMVTMMWRPLYLLRFPCVFWAGFVYGASLVWYNVLNATTSLIFSGPPYNFRSGFVGLTYIGPLIGVFISAMWSGWFGDKFMLWLARRKNGVREPEDRLWLMAAPTILAPVALILWGVGAAKGIHWVGLVFGGGMMACGSAIGAALTINYAIDCYKDLAPEVMLSVMLVRNTLSFAVGYGITPWLGMGLQNTFITAGMVGLAVNASFLIVIRWGKSWRKASARRYWDFVESSVFKH